MKLYILPGACSFAPHVILKETGIVHELEIIDRTTGATASGTPVSTLNPKGYTPILQLDTGEILTEGQVISQYIADQRPEAGLIPAAGTLDRYRVQEWLSFISADLHRSFGALFNSAATDDEKERSKAAIGKVLKYVQAHLESKGDYLVGDRFSVADASAFTVISWCAYFGIELDKFPAVQSYIARIAERPSVVAAKAAEAA